MRKNRDDGIVVLNWSNGGFLFIILMMGVTSSHSAYQKYPPTNTRSKTTKISKQMRDLEDEFTDVAVSPEEQQQPFLPNLFRKENRDRVVDLVRSIVQRGGGSGFSPIPHHDDGIPNWLDRSLRTLSLWLGGIVMWQVVVKFLDFHEDLFHEITDRLLSVESAMAVKTIRQILKQFNDHGVVDVFKKYKTKNVVVSILALSKLQKADAFYKEQKDSDGTKSHHVDKSLLEQLAHYSVYANVAYGWTLEAALRGRLHRGNLSMLLNRTGISSDDVVYAAWESKTHRPSYFIVRDVKHKTIVLAIRGTLSARDVLTDLCATAENFETGGKGKHRAHHGMLESARGVANETHDVVKATLEANPGYSLVIVGHSLGSGVAAVLGTLWENVFPHLMVYGYGSPCVGPIDARPTLCRNIISVVGDGDPFSCMSLGHIADVSNLLAILCEDEALRSLILIRTDGAVDRLEPQDLQWCADTVEKLRQKLTGERLYPPGRILFMKSTGRNDVTLHEVAQEKFNDLRLHPRMMDLSRHVPSLYESNLQKMLNI